MADDSAAVQKVVELTFTDEGMEVFSVGDGQSALDKLEHFTPDVVLVDAFMPGLSGYELCRSIKDDQRFAQIPVMLLVSSFAPFDEGAVQRAGADDFITKPFQSIRQLVNRVDSLLSDKRPAAGGPDEQPMIDVPDSEIPVQVVPDEPHVTVLIEAAQMETAVSHEATGGACAPDIEFQTADTARLDPEMADFEAGVHLDTLELEPHVDEAQLAAPPVNPTPPAMKSEMRMNETVSINAPARLPVSDALLDLDESDFATTAIADDVVLDLDNDEPLTATSQQSSWDAMPAAEPDPVEFEEDAAPEPQESFADDQPISMEAVAEPVAFVEAQVAEAENAPTGPLAYPQGTSAELSPDAINAIARRVIEQMSDQVVREIAWEVVPQLSELMIRKKLEQE